MATITAKLTLDSTNVSTNEALNLSITDSLTVGPPNVGISQVACEVSGGAVVALKPSGSANQYVYIKNTGYQSDGTTATTNSLSVKFASTEGLRIGAGEFAFLPVKSDVVINVISSSSQTILVEYGYWTAA